MEFWSRIKSTLRNLFHKPQIESRLDQELRAYVDMVTDEKISAGMLRPRPVVLRWQSSVAWSK